MQGSQTRSRPPGEVPDEGLPERRGRPGLVTAAAAATALVIVLLNNLLSGAATHGFPVPDDTAPPLPTQISQTLVRVPSLVGEEEPAASEDLAARRLEPVALHRFVACHPAGYIERQDPAPGTQLPVGSTVILVVTDVTSEQLTCPDGVARDEDRALVELVRDFALGVAGARPPTAQRLGLGMLGAAPAVTLSGRDAQDVDRWRVPRPGGDASAPHPVLSDLVLSDHYRVDVGPHGGCVGPVRSPAPQFSGLRQVAVTPAGPPASCLDWWAVDLFVDDTGRIHGVNLDLWEP